MKDQHSDIDHLLQQVLENSELDAPGIDWTAFQDKRKKKKRLLYWWLSAAVIILASLIGVLGQYDRQTEIKTSLSPEPSVNKADIQTPEETTASSAEITKNSIDLTRKVKDEQTRVNDIHTRFADIDNITEWENTSRIYDPLPELSAMRNDRLLNEEMTKRYTRLKNIQAFKWDFDLPVRFAHPQLKINAAGKTILEFGASAFASGSNFRVSELGKAYIHKDYEAIRRKSERPDGGFDLRLAFGRKIGRNELMLGFSYSQRRISGSYDFNYSEKPLIDADGHIIGYDVNTPKHIQYTSQHTLTFVEVPILFRRELKVLQNGHRIRLNIGFVPQFLKGISGSLPNAQFLDLKENLSTENFRNTVLGGELGLSYLIPLSNGMYFNLQPYYTYNSGFKQVQSYYYNRFTYFGLRAGLQMRL